RPSVQAPPTEPASGRRERPAPDSFSAAAARYGALHGVARSGDAGFVVEGDPPVPGGGGVLDGGPRNHYPLRQTAGYSRPTGWSRLLGTHLLDGRTDVRANWITDRKPARGDLGGDDAQDHR